MTRPLWQLLIADPSNLTCDECFAVMEYYAEVLAGGGVNLLPQVLDHLKRCPDCALQHREVLRRLAASQSERGATHRLAWQDPMETICRVTDEMTMPPHGWVIGEVEPMIAFGPVPSRRLGRSLGINNIPPKVCTYSCVYCQLGRTLKMQVQRQAFYEPQEILFGVQDKVEKVREAGEAIDYLTFVSDGEPTLDINLEREIQLLKQLNLPVAVITNASLIWRPDVRQDLMGADWVSLKVDAVDKAVWRRIDRPHGSLELSSILEGVLAFAKEYRGELVTETMLVAGINDGEGHLKTLAGFLTRLQPDRAYLSVPTRPPAEPWVQAPDEQAVNRAYHIVGKKVEQVEYLIGYEGNAFAFTGNAEEDLLSITAVHPMREDAVSTFLTRAGANWAVVQRLVAEGEIVEAEHGGHTFYLRRLRRPSGGA